MKKIGLTGGIGSGKSTVARIFETMNIPVYHADEEAKNLQENDKNIREQIIENFGDEIVEGGIINRKKLAAIVFSDSEKLKRLNDIIHPAVKKHFETWCSKQKEVSFVVKEAAIIFEAGTDKLLDEVILVTAPEDLRIARVMQRSGLSESETINRMKMQWPEEKLKTLAGRIIRNDETELVVPQVLEIIAKLNTAYNT